MIRLRDLLKEAVADLRLKYDDKVEVKDGILYRKGNVVQVWWDKDVIGRKFNSDDAGRETWTAPSESNAIQNFRDMASRWR